MKKIKNLALKRDINGLIKTSSNISSISKSTISGFSIDVGQKEPISFSSYVYYENEDDRDSDFELLTLILNEKK